MEFRSTRMCQCASMATFEHEDLSGSMFRRINLREARFVEADLSGVVMRAVDLAGADIDAPWLLDGDSTMLINGVDVAPFVEAELNRRFPGRELRRAKDPAELRHAWAAVENAWANAVERASSMPTGTVEQSVNGEWSFAQTLRHLVMATDTWLRGAALGVEQPFHPIGQPHSEYFTDGHDPSVFVVDPPTFDEVLTVRAERVAMVRDFVAAVTPDELEQARGNPWSAEHQETVRSCLHVILEEEWEHLRFALRDLDQMAAAGFA